MRATTVRSRAGHRGRPAADSRLAAPSRARVPEALGFGATSPGSALRGLAAASLLIVSFSGAQAQTRTVEILNADSVSVEQGAGGTVRRLVGGVRLRQDTTYLEAPRALQYVERGEVVLDGPVRVRSGEVTLTADHITYNSGSKIAAARGAVRLTDGVSLLVAPSAHYAVREELAAFDAGGTLTHESSVLTAPRGTYDTSRRMAAFEGAIRLIDSTVTLTAERGTYDARARLASFFGDVRLEDSTGVLTADRGRYQTRTRRADFSGNVRLDRPAAEGRAAVQLEADSLVHYRREERSEARGHVVLDRSGEVDGDEGRPTRTLLFGAEVRHDGVADHSDAVGDESDPLLVVIRADSTGRQDTTFARAPRMVSTRVDTLGSRATRVTAAGGARLAGRRFAAIADSVTMVRLDSTSTSDARDLLTLVGNRPSVWSDGAQISADTLRATGLPGAPDTLRAIGQPFAAQLDSTLNRVRQLRGREMLAIFGPDGAERRIRRLSVWPNAEAVYFRADGQGVLAGAEIVTADSLTFLFARGALREVRGMRGIEGTSYGADIVPGNLQLDGYAFEPERRPTRSVLLPPDSWEAEWLERAGEAPTSDESTNGPEGGGPLPSP